MDITLKPVQAGKWTSNLCDCCDDPTSYCEVVFCRPCQVSAQHGMIMQGKVGVDPLCCAGMMCVDAVFWVWAVVSGGCSVKLVSCRNRSEIRKRFGIEGTDCEDCLVSCFCFTCGASQQYREMCYRGMWPGGICVAPPVGALQQQPMGYQQQQFSTPLVAGQPVYQQGYDNAYQQPHYQQGYQQGYPVQQAPPQPGCEAVPIKQI
eukprot:GILI01031701.1.p1 GENE.GILI01031701.1~~GILI01031701.1.p1  ORF type:complete len:205 (-),score=16.80 GILI01031701.1:158-772(-)